MYTTDPLNNENTKAKDDQTSGVDTMEHLMDIDERDREQRNGAHHILRYVVGFVVLVVVVGFSAFVYDYFAAEQIARKEQAVADSRDAFNGGDLDAASKIAEGLVLSDPDNADALLAFANILAQRGSVEFEEEKYGNRAIQIAERVLELEPNNAEAYRIIGYANEILGDYDKAIENYDKAIENDAEFALAYSQKGHTYDLLGDRSAAEYLYIKALSIEPSLDHSLLNMARVHYYRGEYEEARNALSYLLETTDNVRFYAEAAQILGTIALSEGDFIDAGQWFSESLSIDDTLVTALAGLAEARYYQLPDVSEEGFEESLNLIFDILRRANEINPNFTSVYVLAAKTSLVVGGTEQARTFLEQAMDIVDEDITLAADEKDIIRMQIDSLLEELSV